MLKSLLNKLLLVGVFVCCIPGWTSPQTPFSSGGKLLNQIKGVTTKPKMVYDTVRLVDGFGVLRLNKSYKDGKNDVRGTEEKYMFGYVTPSLTDTSGVIYSYGLVISKDSVIVKSSSATDDGKVNVFLFLK